MNASYTSKLLLTKPKESYPESVNDEVNLISFFKKSQPDLFGSYIYRMQKYASDLDLMQKMKYDKELVVVQQFIRALKRIVRDLGKGNRYFSEFKAGIDPYFKKNGFDPYSVDEIIGTLNNGKFNVKPNLPKTIEIMFEDKIINKTERDIILRIIDDTKHFTMTNQEMSYDLVHEIIRNKIVLRWNKKEILDGYKNIRGTKYSLSQAIRDKTMCKIDIIALINNKYVEVTNMISLCHIKNGQCYPINIDEKLLHSPDGLQKEIEKLYYSNKFYSPLKVCKRMYALSRQLKNYSYVDQLGRILRGDTSLLYQIKSEIETFEVLIEKVPKPPLKQIDRQLSEIKGRINTVLDISNENIVNFSKLINEIIKLRSAKSKLEKIKNINKLIKFAISKLCINKMNIVGLNPPPSVLMPPSPKYNRSVVRSVNERPTEEFKKFEKDTIERSKIYYLPPQSVGKVTVPLPISKLIAPIMNIEIRTEPIRTPQRREQIIKTKSKLIKPKQQYKSVISQLQPQKTRFRSQPIKKNIKQNFENDYQRILSKMIEDQRKRMQIDKQYDELIKESYKKAIVPYNSTDIKDSNSYRQIKGNYEMALKNKNILKKDRPYYEYLLKQIFELQLKLIKKEISLQEYKKLINQLDNKVNEILFKDTNEHILSNVKSKYLRDLKRKDILPNLRNEYEKLIKERYDLDVLISNEEIDPQVYKNMSRPLNEKIQNIEWESEGEINEYEIVITDKNKIKEIQRTVPDLVSKGDIEEIKISQKKLEQIGRPSKYDKFPENLSKMEFGNLYMKEEKQKNPQLQLKFTSQDITNAYFSYKKRKNLMKAVNIALKN